MKKEVSCRALNVLYAFLKKRKVDLIKFHEGLPYPAEYFLNKNNWVDYETLLELYKRTRKTFKEPDIFLQIGRQAMSVKVFGFVSIIIHLLNSPRFIYERYPYFVNAMFRDVVQCRLAKEGSHKVVLEYTFGSGYKPSQDFFDITKGLLQATSSLIGFQSAQVVPHRKEQSCLFSISWKARPVWYRRLWYFTIGRPLTIIRAIDDLRESHHLLEKKYDEVSALNVDLKAKIKELEETQIQLIQAGKMGAVGELASGIVHEVASPLSSIQGLTQMLHEELSKESLSNPIFEECLGNIEKACLRMHKVIQHLRIFSYAKPIFNETDVNAVIQDALFLFEPKAKKASIKIITHLDMNVPKIMAESNQLEQVFLNIFNNAKDALSSEDAPEIHVTSRFTNHHVEIEIKDNGPGIPRNTQEKIFDPFFTTKKIGKGMGLGLSICKKIADLHSGNMRVESKPGHGASFIISLPIKQEAQKAA